MVVSAPRPLKLPVLCKESLVEVEANESEDAAGVQLLLLWLLLLRPRRRKELLRSSKAEARDLRDPLRCSSVVLAALVLDLTLKEEALRASEGE